MTEINSSLENKFWSTFEKTLGRSFDRQCQVAAETEEWDSLRHVELIFELEQRFEVDIGPDDIAALYSNTDTIIQFLTKNAGA